MVGMETHLFWYARCVCVNVLEYCNSCCSCCHVLLCVFVQVIDANEDSKKNAHVFAKQCSSILEKLDYSQESRTLTR